MIIQFLCPNGHKLHCDAKRAGMAAKCPKCGEKFRIPTLAEAQTAQTVAAEALAPGSPAEPQAAVAGPAVRRGPATASDQIEFLCPNNHLLHAPRELQTQPGECPECGSRFRIPSYEKMPVEEEMMVEPASGSPGGSIGLAEASSRVEDVPTAVGPPGLERADLAVYASEKGSEVPAASPHPFFGVFCRLWAYKAHGATVEVRYGEGQRLVPDRFAKGLSGGTHGVFVVDEPNNTYTLTAIAWDSIWSVVVRGSKSPPKETD